MNIAGYPGFIGTLGLDGLEGYKGSKGAPGQMGFPGSKVRFCNYLGLIKYFLICNISNFLKIFFIIRS